MKYIFIVGGPISGLGKGITASSIGYILKQHGKLVTMIKVDPYLNKCAGTIGPLEHGEVYVTRDGAETDLDIGNYERFLDISLSKNNSITTGKIYKIIADKEKNLHFSGKTIQLIPHFRDEIITQIENGANYIPEPYTEKPDICIVEIGGTVGDMEHDIYMHSIKRMEQKLGKNNVTVIFVGLLYKMGTEYKTKPIQNSVKELGKFSINPDFMVVRSETNFIETDIIPKLSLSCNILEENIIRCPDQISVYHVPGLFIKQGFNKSILSYLYNTNLDGYTCINTMDRHASFFANRKLNPNKIKVAVVGKYHDKDDTYLSIMKALMHVECLQNRVVEIVGINTDGDIHYDELDDISGILIPGGFGTRGIEGIISIIKYAREEKKPLLAICLGFQAMIIEVLRNKGINASSSEFSTSDTSINVIELNSKDSRGNTMRLGEKEVTITKCSSLSRIYDTDNNIFERFRHRYKLGKKYESYLNDVLKISARNKIDKSVVGVEYPNGMGIGVQYHPEFLSRLSKPSPPFVDFVNKSFKYSKKLIK